MATNPALFAAWMTPYAEQASAATGLDVGLIIAQWGNETAWGTEFAEKNNIGNVGVYGGGPNPSYATLAEGVGAYINEMNSPAMASAKAKWSVAGTTAAQQAAIVGASGYAGGGYNNGGGPGSSLVADMATAGLSSSATAGSSLTTADWQALNQAQQQGGTAYLTALNAQSQTAAGSGAAAAAPASGSSGGTTFNIPGYGTTTVTGQQATALETIQSTLAAYGFSPSQTATLTQWAWGEITNNVDPTQIAIDLQTPGTTGYQVFEQQFPGFVAANAQLNAQGLPAVSVQAYSQYQTTAMAMAQAAGLPAGMINSQNIGTLVGGNVSTSELSNRLNDAMVLAYQSTPEQQATFNQYFGTSYGQSGQGALTASQIASLALEPNVAEPLIAQQIKSAQIGGASVTSGVGAIDAATATELAQAGITPADATKAFQNLAPYSALETPRPGMGGEAAQGVVSPEQLATGQLLGNAAAQRQLVTAEEVAKAPFSGGGGFVSNTKGVAGAGSASSSGAGQT